jgi:hypothetical protein
VKRSIINTAIVLLAFAIGSACTAEKVADVKDKASETKAKAADAIAAKIEAKVLDYLKCQGITSAAVLKGVSQLMADRDKLKVSDLLAAPDGVAELAGRSRDAREVARELADVARAFADQKGLFDHGKPGWDVSKCSGELAVPCLVGDAKFTFTCEGSSTQATGLGTFSKCNLGALKLDGKLRARPGPAGGGVVLDFEGFAIGDARTLDGAVHLAGDVSATGLTVGLDAASTKPLVITAHGGAKGGLSCGQTTTVSKLKLTVTDKKIAAEVEITLATKEDEAAVKTIAPHLTWTYADNCPCPDDGSAVELVLPRPGGEDGEKATMQVRFAAASGASCRSTTVALTDWPTDCSLKDKIISACGEGPRDAAQTIASEVSTRMCVAWE